MRAIVQSRYGGSDQLHLEEVPQPRPGRDEVLVRVQAAGVDRGTWHLMVGQPLMVRAMFGLRGPRVATPGRDLSGIVVAVGEGVQGYGPGDAVLGTAAGSFAELAVVPVSRLAHRPPELNPVDAAALPVSGLTALKAVETAGVGAGQRVLVIGASGGVGSFSVQLARRAGAEVTGVCSPAKADLVRALGATAVIDRTSAPIDSWGGDYDVVIDMGGNHPLRQVRRLLTDSGTLVLVGGEEGGRMTGGIQRSVGAAMMSAVTRQRLIMLISKEAGDQMARLAQLAAAGELRAVVERTFPLDQAGAAIDHVGSGRARGKVVIVVDPALASPEAS